MKTYTIISCFTIFAGALIMLINIIKAQKITKALPLVVENHQRSVRLWLVLHRALMVFFLLGYLGVFAAFLLKIELISETFVSFIFLFGALFVLFSILIEERLISEVYFTMNKLLPICMYCKSIRIEGGNPDNPADWKPMEAYFSKRDKVNFSHGLCPKCSSKKT